MQVLPSVPFCRWLRNKEAKAGGQAARVGGLARRSPRPQAQSSVKRAPVSADSSA